MDTVPFVPQSQFQLTPVFKVDGELVYGLRRPLPPSSEDTVHVVDGINANRLDMLSQIEYRTPNYWWAIADANNLIDVQFGIPDGTALKIPSKGRLSSLKIL